MVIRQGYSLPELILQLNVPQRTIMYRGIVRDISANLFEKELANHLYPLWDTDKDKLITFTWYDNQSYICERRKFLKDFKTDEYYWKNYEMESYDSDDGTKMYDLLKDIFYLVESDEKQNFQQEMATLYYKTTQSNWANIRLIRNFLLSDSDWSVSNDCPLSEEDKTMWIRYRKELRNLPLTNMQNNPYIKIDDIKFPIDPNLFKAIYFKNRPEETYLDTADQYIPIAKYYLTTFKERMIQYLLAKEITMDIYYKQFLTMLNFAPDIFDPESHSVFTTDKDRDLNRQENILNNLITHAENLIAEESLND